VEPGAAGSADYRCDDQIAVRDFRFRAADAKAASLPLQFPHDGYKVPAHGDGESRGLSVQAESGGAGQGAWEIGPAT